MSCPYSLCLTSPLPFHSEPITTGFLPLTHKLLALALSGHQGHFIGVALGRSWLLLLHLLAAFNTADYSSGIHSPLYCLDTPLLFFLFPLGLVFLLCWFLISPNSKQSTSGHCISSLSTTLYEDINSYLGPGSLCELQTPLPRHLLVISTWVWLIGIADITSPRDSSRLWSVCFTGWPFLGDPF